MYTERDQSIIDYVAKFKAASTSTLIHLFFGNKYRYGAKRLRELTKRGDLNRARCLGDTYDYIYYTGRRPKQLLHKLLLTEFHRELSKISREVRKFDKEYTCGHVRADGFVAFRLRNKGFIAFVEVQTRNYQLDTGKYRQLLLSGEWKQHFPVFPMVIAITDQRLKKTKDFKLIHIKTDLDLSLIKELELPGPAGDIVQSYTKVVSQFN